MRIPDLPVGRGTSLFDLPITAALTSFGKHGVRHLVLEARYELTATLLSLLVRQSAITRSCIALCSEENMLTAMIHVIGSLHSSRLYGCAVQSLYCSRSGRMCVHCLGVV
jgi:hypothetical protein